MSRLLAVIMLTIFLVPMQIVCSQDKNTDAVQLAAVSAADDARVSAMRDATKEKLEAVLSDDLHYAHSSGLVDTKKSLMDALVSGKTRYIEMKYEKREFSLPAPNVALMTGRVRVKVEAGANKLDSMLSFLAVWRFENGQWKFLAWQSCKLP